MLIQYLWVLNEISWKLSFFVISDTILTNKIFCGNLMVAGLSIYIGLVLKKILPQFYFKQNFPLILS